MCGIAVSDVAHKRMPPHPESAFLGVRGHTQVAGGNSKHIVCLIV
jgi:hypothetical protein